MLRVPAYGRAGVGHIITKRRRVGIVVGGAGGGRGGRGTCNSPCLYSGAMLLGSLGPSNNVLKRKLTTSEGGAKPARGVIGDSPRKNPAANTMASLVGSGEWEMGLLRVIYASMSERILRVVSHK